MIYCRTVNVTINGDARDVSAGTVAQLVSELGLAGRAVAIELNREVVPRTLHAERKLNEGDRIEVVEFAGGG